jgi:hypothetical protein
VSEKNEKSEKPTIIEALLAVMGDVQAVGKDGRNTEQGYNFRGIDAVVNAVGPAFRTHGVIAVPVKSVSNYRDVLTSKGKPSRECTVTVTYRFYGPAGDYIDSEAPGESMDFGDKGTAKAMSVAYRILLLQALCIPTDDVDPDASSYERAHGDVHADPVTDPEWLAQAEGRLTEAGSLEQLGQVAGEIRAHYLAGKVAKVHSDHLLHLFQQRQAELNGQAAA